MYRTISPLLTGILLGVLGTIGVATASSPSLQAALLVDEARQELSQARALVHASAHSASARQRLQERLRALDQTLFELDQTVEALQGPPALSRVSSAELHQIRLAIDAESFSDDQLEVLRRAARGRAFTTAQVVQIMDLFAFGDDKVEAAAMLYETVVDPEQWYLVYPALSFSSDKSALRARTG